MYYVLFKLLSLHVGERMSWSTVSVCSSTLWTYPV